MHKSPNIYSPPTRALWRQVKVAGHSSTVPLTAQLTNEEAHAKLSKETRDLYIHPGAVRALPKLPPERYGMTYLTKPVVYSSPLECTRSCKFQ